MAKRGTRAKSTRRRSTWRRGLVLAAFTVVSVVCMSWFAARDWVGKVQPARLSQLADSELVQHFRTLVRKGPGEIARVVESLVAKRTALQSAAARTLHEEIERCAKATADEAVVQLDRIAEALATHAPRFNKEALATAAALAERILAVPQRASSKSDRLRNCHIVLKEEAQRRMHERARATDSMTRSLEVIDQPSIGPAAASRPEFTVSLAPLAGGGLAAVPGDLHPRPLARQAASQAKPLKAQATNPPGTALTSRLNSPSQLQSVGGASDASDVSSLISLDRRNRAVSADQSQLQRSSKNAVEPTSAASASPPMPRDLARLLESAERVGFGGALQSAATRAELSWLGIDESQLKLARGAVDDDPQVRREVVEALPSVANVDARGWLLWFSRDRDADVRRAAIALLATASDPALRKRVREAAESDADPRVRQQAKAAVVAESDIR